MNISLRLKYTELQSLVAELERVLLVDECNTRNEAIIGVLMLKLYRKLKQKCAIIEPRIYTISIEPEYAIAFVQYFTKRPVNLVSHAGNIIQKMVALFDQQTSNYHTC
jgi:hypothetical protein